MKQFLFSLFSLAGIQCWSQTAVTHHIEPSDTLWKTLYGKVETRDYMGREAIYLDKGIAYLPESQFSNGELDVDIAPSNPGFGGLVFHLDSSLNYEEVYMRYIKSGWADAAQYSPVFNGESSWQLYPEYQGLLKYPAAEWIHMKIKVQNRQAKVYFMGSDTASIYIDSLRVPANKGMIGIWSLQGAYFSNLSYKETSNESLTGKDQMLYNTQAIKTWEISPAFSFRFSDIEHFDLSGFRNLQWKKALTEEDGLLNINRYARKKIFGKFKDNSEELVWLRYEWNEPKAGIKPFSFEFTNRCFIFLNGQKAFAGNNSFRLKGPLDRGSFDKHMRGNICYLPVQKGRNSLMIGVAGVANGWGFMGTFEDNSNKGFIKY